MNACRLANPDDAAGVLAIYAPIVRDTAISFEWEVPELAEMTSRMEKVLQKRPWLVYREGAEILGYAYATTFRERAAYQWGVEVSIYVRADAQKHGIGKTLYATLFDVLRAQNYCRVVAGATMPNASSERLHRAFGFEFMGLYPAAGYKFGAWHDVIFWYLPLRELPAVAPELININDLVKTKEWAWLTKS